MRHVLSLLIVVGIILQITPYTYASDEEKTSFVIDSLMQSAAAQSDVVVNNITVQDYSKLQNNEWTWIKPTTDYYKNFALRRKNNYVSKSFWNFLNQENLPVWALSTDYLDRSMRFMIGIQSPTENMGMTEESTVITGNLELRYHPPENHLGFDMVSKNTAGFEPNNSGADPYSTPSTQTSASISSM